MWPITDSSSVRSTQIGPLRDGSYSPSAEPPVPFDGRVCLVVEHVGGDVVSRAVAWASLIEGSGIVSRVVTDSQIEANASLLDSGAVVVLDPSTGSGNGSELSQTVLDNLVRADLPIVLLGRAAWLEHRLQGLAPPLETALAETWVYNTTPGLEDAVFLSWPNKVDVPSELTSEASLRLPVDAVQTEESRLVNLTGSSDPALLAPLRHDSQPLDTFLLAMENPDYLTSSGQNLTINVISLAASIAESSTAQRLSEWQVLGREPEGGMFYPHEATMEALYYSVRAMRSSLSDINWTVWLSNHQDSIAALLQSMTVSGASETGFAPTQADTAADVLSASRGLYLIQLLSLTDRFDVNSIISYISSRQDVDGGFGSDILTTHCVLEALRAASALNKIDTAAAESWLRDCVIDGSKTSEPERWGGVAQNPSSITPKNSYARALVLSLQILGTSHNDPAKLTDWILSQTSEGDGSFSDTMNPGVEVTVGTASAITAMSVMGTLSPSNRTAAIEWFRANQLASGGFGLGSMTSDLVAKTLDTSYVAMALNETGADDALLRDGIITYVNSVETEAGFEVMECVPSLMNTYWMTQLGRYTHAGRIVDTQAIFSFLDSFSSWSEYPSSSNMSFLASPEFSPSQFRMKSVWTQYFGVESSYHLYRELTAAERSDVIDYLTGSQSADGHFRNARLPGPAHMQYSVAAVETLYLMGSLSKIPYPDELRAAVLAEYRDGYWSRDGWTLRPYCRVPQAIDYLSTRAALRLGLLNSSMASQIISTIQARINYSDLLAVGFDSLTVGLLASSGLISIDVASVIDPDAALSSLGPSMKDTGWFNATILYQPLYTSIISRMLSVLGLRVKAWEPDPRSLSAVVETVVHLGSTADINVSISSSPGNSTVVLYAFGQWSSFGNVSPKDNLVIHVPDDADDLGPAVLYLRVEDYGAIWATSRLETTVNGTLTGEMALDRHDYRIGSPITGLVSWELTTGRPAGTTNATVSLTGADGAHQWSYCNASPLVLSLPTDNLTAGRYNLSVLLERPYCDSLILSDWLELFEPEPTYVETLSNLTTLLGDAVSVNWTLRVLANDSALSGQWVHITITDSNGSPVYSADDRTGAFVWTPGERGVYNFTITFDGNRSLAPSETSGQIVVEEPVVIEMLNAGQYDQYTNVTLEVRIRDSSGGVVSGLDITLKLVSPSSQTVVVAPLRTNELGLASITAYLGENGQYVFSAEFGGEDYYTKASNSSEFTSYSVTTLTATGLPGEALVTDTLTTRFNLTDTAGVRVVGQIIHVTVTFLPSTVVLETDVTTDDNGVATFVWSTETAGQYEVAGSYAGSPSLGPSSTSSIVSVYIPLTVTITVDPAPSVGEISIIVVTVEDNLGDPVDQLQTNVTVTGPSGVAEVAALLVTDSGIARANWTPGQRGEAAVVVVIPQQGWYASSMTNTSIAVSDTAAMMIDMPKNPVAPGRSTVSVSLTDSLGEAISNCTVEIEVHLDATLILKADNVTDPTGTILVGLNLTHPGELQVNISVPAQGYLSASKSSANVHVLGITTLSVDAPQAPVLQNSTVGILVVLTDWRDSALVGATIRTEILWSNGTLYLSSTGQTAQDGSVSFLFEMSTVGDFVINVTFSGDDTNAASQTSIPLRIYCVPDVFLEAPISSYSNDTLRVSVYVTDEVGDPVVGRNVSVRFEQDGVSLHEETIVTSNVPVVVEWVLNLRGRITVIAMHLGDDYYHQNSSSASVSVMEIVDGQLILSSESIEFADSVDLTYRLDAADCAGITVLVELLGVDLVPVWSSSLTTNSTGYVSAMVTVDMAVGPLVARAGPADDQYMLGGDVQQQLTVMTDATVNVVVSPEPPCATEPVVLNVHLYDELGGAIDGLSVTISLLDPYGDPVRLGTWSDAVTITTVDGIATVDTTVSEPGLYTVLVDSSGSRYVHSFSFSSQWIAYSRTNLTILSITDDLEVGDTLSAVVLLLDHTGTPMSGSNITFLAQGPDGSTISETVATNATGYCRWEQVLLSEGEWHFVVTFEGLGVYLADSAERTIDVRFGVRVVLVDISEEQVVAGDVPLRLSLLLTDLDGGVLEGFTMRYLAYHQSRGLLIEGALVQSGTTPENLTIEFPLMGNYSLFIVFDGTDHYHPASTVVEVFVMGTTSPEITGPTAIHRSTDEEIVIRVYDESRVPLGPTEVGLTVTLLRGLDPVNVTSRLILNETCVELSLRGLDVGDYSLLVTVPGSSLRLGSTATLDFTVTAETALCLLESDLPGIVGWQHEVVIAVHDLLNATVWAGHLTVSVFDPDGRQLLGGVLTSGLDFNLTDIEEADITWTPGTPGEYTLTAVFSGTSYYSQANLSVVLRVRYLTEMEVDIPAESEFGTSIPVSARLRGPLGGIGSATLVIRVRPQYGDEIVLTEETDITGTVRTEFYPPVAGVLTVSVEYAGSDDFNSTTETMEVVVRPTVTVEVLSVENAFAGQEMRVSLSIEIAGVAPGWNTSLQVAIFGPDGSLLKTLDRTIESSSLLPVTFSPPTEGEYIIDVTIEDVPVLGDVANSVSVAVSTMGSSLGIGLTPLPVFISIPMITLLGVVVRNRMNVALSRLPVDWDDSIDKLADDGGDDDSRHLDELE